MLLTPSNNTLEERRVICWEWKGNARDEGEAAAQWASEILGEPSRLVRFIGKTHMHAQHVALKLPTLALPCPVRQQVPGQGSICFTGKAPMQCKGASMLSVKGIHQGAGL